MLGSSYGKSRIVKPKKIIRIDDLTDFIPVYGIVRRSNRYNKFCILKQHKLADDEYNRLSIAYEATMVFVLLVVLIIRIICM